MYASPVLPFVATIKPLRQAGSAALDAERKEKTKKDNQQNSKYPQWHQLKDDPLR